MQVEAVEQQEVIQYFQLSHQQAVAEVVAEVQIQAQPEVQVAAVQVGAVAQVMQAEQVILHQFLHLKVIQAVQVQEILAMLQVQVAAVVPVQ